jgi:hypothetical protein
LRACIITVEVPSSSERYLKFVLPDRTVVPCGVVYMFRCTVLELTRERTQRRGDVGSPRRLVGKGRVLWVNLRSSRIGPMAKPDPHLLHFLDIIKEIFLQE